jgi:hypothetical protein
MWESLQHAGWVTVVSDTGWLYAAVSILHYFTLFVFIGTIALLDLRLLGIAARGRTIAQLAQQVLPWNWIVFALAVISGFVLFATDAVNYVPVGLFQLKLLVIALAVLATIIVQRGLRTWDQAPIVPVGARILALISLALWVGAILAAVDISYIAGIG